MPAAKEFTIHMDDRPGTLGKLCRALGDRGVTIVAFQAFPHGKDKSTLRLVTDNPRMTKTVLESENTAHTETEVALTNLPHRAGSLGRVATKLGEAKININYTYAGLEPGTNTPVAIFGVAEVGQAAKILDEVAKAAA